MGMLKEGSQFTGSLPLRLPTNCVVFVLLSPDLRVSRIYTPVMAGLFVILTLTPRYRGLAVLISKMTATQQHVSTLAVVIHSNTSLLRAVVKHSSTSLLRAAAMAVCLVGLLLKCERQRPAGSRHQQNPGLYQVRGWKSVYGH